MAGIAGWETWLMSDLLHYDIGKSVFGWLAGKLLIYQKDIFDYRYKILVRYFSIKSH